MAKRIPALPKQIFASLRENVDGSQFVEARETADEFDEEGPVGRYELVEEGTITIANAFVPKARLRGR